MLEHDAQAFYRAGVELRTMRMAFDAALKKHPEKERELPADEDARYEIRTRISELATICRTMAVPSTKDAVERLAVNVVKPASSYRFLMELLRDVEMRLIDDLKRVTMAVIDSNRAPFFSKAIEMFGPDVQTKYPSVIFEIDEAGKCFALGRYTASVFHLMRIMEIAVHATARCLGIPNPIKPAKRNWGAILKVVNDAIVAKKGAWANQDDAEFFGNVYLSLDRVRNVWRNSTMHVENKYTEDEAREIFDAVRSLMKRFTSRFDESGQPLA